MTDDHQSHDDQAMLPIGWPVGRFGATMRAPVETVTYWDAWGTTRPR